MTMKYKVLASNESLILMHFLIFMHMLCVGLVVCMMGRVEVFMGRCLFYNFKSKINETL